MKTLIASFAVVLALACGGAAAALAQAPNADRKPCSEMGGDPSKTLSQKLDQGSGVICPPDVDPAIKAPTPDAGNPAAGQSRRRSESAAEMRAPAKRGARAKIR